MALIDSASNLFVHGKQLFTVNYEAGKDTLPEDQGWNYRDPASMPNQPSVSSGIMHQGLTEVVGNQDWFAIADDAGDFLTDNIVCEIKIKINSSSRFIGGSDPNEWWRTGWTFAVSDNNGRGFEFGLSASGIDFSNDLGDPNSANNLSNSITPVDFDTTDDFHIYRLEIANGSGTLLVDGNIVGSLTAGIIYGVTTNRIVWGDNTTFANGETDLIYVQTDIFYPEFHQDDLNLYTQASTEISVSGDLMIHGVILTPPPTGDIEGRFVDEFCRTSDFIPTLMGQFISTSPSGVTIELWDIINGDNTPLILIDDTVQQVGDTESWMWSMTNMPSDNSADGQFLFRMTADTGETIEREVTIKTIADGQWKHE